MKRKIVPWLVLVVCGMMLAPFAWAAVKPDGLKLNRPMVIAGVYLRAAIYDVQWQVHDTHATVIFSQHGHAVATVQGELVTFKKSVSKDTLYFTKYPDGSVLIRGLGFAGTNRVVAFPTIRPHPLATSHGSTTIQSIGDGLRGGAPVPRRFR